MTETYSDMNRANPTVASATVITPTDRVRWGPIFAGLFAAMSVLAVLSVLGIATAMSNVDAGDQPRDFGIGAGIWGAISALLAFFFGGWMAARTAATRGDGNGVLQGAMVWMVAIPLMLYLLAGGVGAMFRTAGSVAATGVQAASSAAPAVSDNPEMRNDVKATTQQVTEDVKAKANELRAQVTPERVEQAAESGAKAAWGTLVSMLLGLAAAAVGGYLGSRGDDHGVRRTV